MSRQPMGVPARVQSDGSSQKSSCTTAVFTRTFPACRKLTVTRAPITDCTWPGPQSGRPGWRTHCPGSMAVSGDGDMTDSDIAGKIHGKANGKIDDRLKLSIFVRHRRRIETVRDCLRLTELMCARMCHDLGGPLGSLTGTIEL